MSLEQAKQRLREAAREAGPAGWIRQHPREAVLLALVAGLALGATPNLRQALSQGLGRALRCL